MRTYLIAHDLSPYGDAACGEAAQLVRPGDKVLLLHVHAYDYPAPGQTSGEVTYQEEQVDRKLLERLAQQFEKDTGVRPVVDVQLGTPVETILDEAEREGADMIVIGTHGRSGIRRALLGSVAEAVVREAKVPVVVVKRSATARAASNG